MSWNNKDLGNMVQQLQDYMGKTFFFYADTHNGKHRIHVRADGAPIDLFYILDSKQSIDENISNLKNILSNLKSA